LAQDHIERLRRAYAAFSRGDFDEALTYAHPDIEYVPSEGAAPVRGLETFRAWMEPRRAAGLADRAAKPG
jgi:ketosteroid isomerase-like protein